MRGPVCFLSDYGLDDEFVGVVHRVIAAAAPGVAVLDITHGVPAHDVRAGALTLWRALPWLVPCVVLGVVDPGVGTARRAVVVEVAGAGALLVGPDNGLLLPAALALGPVTTAVELEPPERLSRGATFDGRDLFAPAAARLAAGAEPGSLGRSVDPASLDGDALSEPERLAGGALACEVLWVDRFGNAQLNARPSDAERLGDTIEVALGDARVRARRAGAYADLGPGQFGLVHDSYGMLALSLDREPAASHLGLRPGDRVVLTRGGRPSRG
ncbi:MAG: SAM hydrolase/SAM-dependent halogenase family protein [Acidimicrobiales bacterium]